MRAVLHKSYKRLITPMPAAQLPRVKDIATTDSVITALRDIIQRGWPNTKSGISENLYPYFDIRDELIVQDNLIFKGSQLVIPATMRREMMSLTHASHIGIEGCIRRAQCIGLACHQN